MIWAKTSTQYIQDVEHLQILFLQYLCVAFLKDGCRDTFICNTEQK